MTPELLAVQVKHKRPGALNEGELIRTGGEHAGPFDLLDSKDEAGYARGPVRPLFKEYAFELGTVATESRDVAFVNFFSKVYAHSRSDDPAM